MFFQEKAHIYFGALAVVLWTLLCTQTKHTDNDDDAAAARMLMMLPRLVRADCVYVFVHVCICISVYPPWAIKL